VLEFRETRTGDVTACFAVRGRTREHAISREQLAAVGITPASVAADLASGRVLGRVCADDGEVVAFCSGDAETGEVLVLAVLAEYEGKRIGKRLLADVVDALRARGHRRLWLTTSPDPASRAYGFYRAQGWLPSGKTDAIGDEILVLDLIGRRLVRQGFKALSRRTL
jgi:ribosomal protein S18 acetylase RimI-like enzyme